ncbi:MAG TPA: hypothetical protein PKH05_17765 [Nitrospira sp.]|nr:hypothetical protein [Nitrospira sp.]
MTSKQQPKGRRMTREELFAIDGRTLGAMTSAEERFARALLTISRRIGTEKTKAMTEAMQKLYDDGGTRDDALMLLAEVQSAIPTLQ